jgi:acylpyruvate hydrolase
VRLVTYDAGGGPAAGVLLDGQIAPAGPSVRTLLADGGDVRAGDERLPLDGVRLLAPVPDPQKIICLGLNYVDHAEESHQPIPENPMWFAKFQNSLVGDGEPVILPPTHAEFVDYEAELAVVIGRRAHHVSPEEALDHVAGAMPFNDVSARDLQLQNPLWTSGKAIDTFAPCGPALVLMDEIDDLQALGLRTRINGEVVQEGTTANMIFPVAETVAWLSETMTLLPGDIIATGTPAGIGGPKGLFLHDGDTVSVEVDGLGAVTNPVRSTAS